MLSLTSQKAISCYSVAEILLDAAKKEHGMRFQADRLIALGESIIQQDQIEPITGFREKRSGEGEFIRLLVDERQFWSLAIIAVRLELKEESTLDVILKERHNIGEQLAEYLQRDDLTSVDLAKGIASLILTKRGAPPDQNDSKYFESATGASKRTCVLLPNMPRTSPGPPGECLLGPYAPGACRYSPTAHKRFRLIHFTGLC